MKKLLAVLALILALVIVGVGLPMLLNGEAEALPSKTVNDLYTVEGAEISGAPVNALMLDWVRVDLHGPFEEERTVRLKIPYEPPDLCGAVLYDGWHWINCERCTLDGDEITAVWKRDVLEKLDGTVGVYLILIFSY